MLLFIAAAFLVASQHSVKGLDKCGLVTVTTSSPASHYGTLTPFYGNGTVWEEYITTGATCSTDGGTFANLEAVLWTETNAKYRCKCMGSWASTQTRYCTLHVWRCPKGGHPNSTRVRLSVWARQACQPARGWAVLWLVVWGSWWL